ncbi:MAG TPA: hypothetical protein VFN94_10950 [Nitrospiria bacterium]|nr:hypothetical protein [Nitrospiria bacterium]
MTLIEARQIVRTMLFGATGRADVDQITLDTILDATNKALWLRAVKAAQSMFTAFWDVTVTANSRGQYELWQLDGNPPNGPGVHRVVKVELFAQNGGLIQLDAISLTDRAAYDPQSPGAICTEPAAWYPAYNDANFTIYTNPPVNTYSEAIVFVPRPSRDIRVRIHCVQNLPKWTDNEDALGGIATLQAVHVLVPVTAAVMLGARNLTDLRDELTKDFNDALVKRHGGPRRAHFVPYE